MAPTISPLASNIVAQIPALLERLRKYDEQNGALGLRYDNLEREIVFMRRSIENEQEKQRRTREQIAELEVGAPRKQRKRPRVDDEGEEENRVVKPRIEAHDKGGVKPLNSPRGKSGSCSSTISIGSKRKARLFSAEEANSIGGPSVRFANEE